MCGFFISNSKEVGLESETILRSGLKFRGPDAESGVIQSNGWTSYHARLSIIDIATSANQPVINSDGSQLVFNGEILNYQELGEKYFSRKFSSDTMLLNDLILSDNLRLEELDGFFAFVFIDGAGILKHAVRDRFGVKPLFFYRSGDEISFSSEPSVLQKLFDLKVNDEAVEEYKIFRTPLFQGSFFSGVHQVAPGECIQGGVYFDLVTEMSAAEYAVPERTKLETALQRGIESRMVSDVPVGLLLSKGVDSNLLREFGDFDKLYSIGFAGDEDISYLENQRFPGLSIVKPTNEEFLEAFDHLLALRGEPMSVPNEVLLFLVSKLAKSDGIKVLLSGEGADEFFGGYDRVFGWAAGRDEFSVAEFLDFYAYDKVEKGSKCFQYVEKLFHEVNLSNPFEMVRWFFIKFHMPVLFRRLDFALMAAGVEGREPIANQHLFTSCIRFCGKDLIFGELGKKPLRDLLSLRMGDFAYEKKVGFPVDLTKIFSNPRNLSSYELWFEKNLEILN